MAPGDLGLSVLHIRGIGAEDVFQQVLAGIGDADAAVRQFLLITAEESVHFQGHAVLFRQRPVGQDGSIGLRGEQEPGGQGDHGQGNQDKGKYKPERDLLFHYRCLLLSDPLLQGSTAGGKLIQEGKPPVHGGPQRLLILHSTSPPVRLSASSSLFSVCS